MLSRWFQSFTRRAFLADVGTFDTLLQAETQRMRVLRAELLNLYDEIELAIRAMDLLVERADHARAQVKDRLLRPGAPEPAVFSATYRQRATSSIEGGH